MVVSDTAEHVNDGQLHWRRLGALGALERKAEGRDAIERALKTWERNQWHDQLLDDVLAFIEEPPETLKGIGGWRLPDDFFDPCPELEALFEGTP